MEKFGAARLRVVGEDAEVSPEHAVFEAMLDGWRTQRLSRNLAFGTVESGARVLRRFQDEVGRYPWQWSPEDLENWVAGLRAGEGRANSTIRSYGLTVSAFLDYVCDPAYGWDTLCLQRFGTHAVQICGPANLAVHTIDQEARPSRRPLTRSECQALFDAADERTEAVSHRGAKGWAPAFRDATMLKVAYAWGLRRRELLMLERCDFGPNPKASEFGAFGVCHVRFGKAANGSPPTMTTRPGYSWNLRQIMATKGLWKTSELGPLLEARGIALSSAQVYRLVANTPERLSLRTLAALCDILACTPSDLISITAEEQRPTARSLRAKSRPRRARVGPS